MVMMTIHVSECKYYCLHLVPKFGDVRDRQNWQLHPTAQGRPQSSGESVHLSHSASVYPNKHLCGTVSKALEKSNMAMSIWIFSSLWERSPLYEN